MKTGYILAVLLYWMDFLFLDSLFSSSRKTSIIILISLCLIMIYFGSFHEHIKAYINQAIRLDKMPVNTYSMFYKESIKDIYDTYTQFYYLEDDRIEVTHYGLHSIVVTKGMLKLHDEDILRSCISHEMGHIYRGDIFFQQAFTLNIFALIFFILSIYSGVLAVIFIIAFVLLILGSFTFNRYFTTSLLIKGLRSFIKMISELLLGINHLILDFYISRSDYAADQYAVKLDENNRYSLIHYLNRYESHAQKRIKKLEDY